MSSKKIEINDAAVEIEDVAQEVIEALVKRAGQAGGVPFLTTSATVSDHISMPGLQPLGKEEQACLYALLAFAAQEQDVRQETIEAMLEAEMGVRHIGSIKERDFERAVVFLMELRVDAHTN